MHPSDDQDVSEHPAAAKVRAAFEEFIEKDVGAERLHDAVFDASNALVPPRLLARAAELIHSAIEATEQPSAGRLVAAAKALKEVENFLLDEVERANEISDE